MPEDTRAPNVSQLRDAIDSGKTGDKTPFSDPAASPLGTDAEAGGVPPTAADVELSFAQETDGRADKDANASAKVPLPGVSGGGPTASRKFGPEHTPWLLAGGFVAFVLVLWFAMSRLGLLL